MRRFPKHLRGAAVVELAFIIIPLTLMAVAAFDFARSMWVYEQLTRSVRAGARYLSFFDPTIAAEYPTAAAKNIVLYGSINAPADGKPLIPGLDASMIQICDRTNATACPGESFSNVTTGKGSLNLVKMSITGYVFAPVFPGASMITSATFETISATLRQI